jgi:diketogulonate reductase-like aldo/keto reductase
MEHVTVRDVDVPAIGLGTWQLSGKRWYETVKTALELGYRHVDTAQLYGNEAEVGRGIADVAVDREDVFLTTKVRPGRPGPPTSSRAPARAWTGWTPTTSSPSCCTGRCRSSPSGRLPAGWRGCARRA